MRSPAPPSTLRLAAARTCKVEPRTSRTKARRHHRCDVPLRDAPKHIGWRNAARSVSCCGTFVPASRFTVWVWSGNRTRDTRFMKPMLYPSELSRGGRTGFEPAADGFRRCSATELPSSRNTFSRPRAYATAAPRAPDGRASPYRWKPFERCFALAPRQRHQSCCAIASARHPCPASGHSACAPHGRFPSQAFHARMLGMRIDHANTLVAPFASAQKKTPPDVDPRAFAFLGDRGDRSP